ncbi:hypothetical protein ACK302_15690, partial [Aeromonas caviae]
WIMPPRSPVMDMGLCNWSEIRISYLVHGREETVTTEDVREMLEAVRDLLYMLDYYRGHGWAMERLSPEVAANLQEQ